MESFKKAIFLASTIIAVLPAEDATSGLEEKFELMEEKFELMSSKISQLETNNLRLTTELESLSTLTAFDCYLAERWDKDDPNIIQFNGCSGTILDLIHFLADFYQ